MLVILRSFYSTRLKISGDLVDLGSSISNLNIQEAARLIPRGHFHCPMMIAALRRSLFLLLQASGWSADLNKSIGLLEANVQTMPDDDTSKPSSLAHLGSLFFMRFQQLNDLPARQGDVGA
jgi:hypothetical protein